MEEVNCPQCGVPMNEVREPDVVIDTCPQCDGVFLQKTGLNSLVTGIAGDVEGRSLVWTSAIEAAEGDPPRDKFGLRCCPLCDEDMKKVLMLLFENVVVDYCLHCESYFLDKGEIQHVNSRVPEEGRDEYRKFHGETLVRVNRLFGTNVVYRNAVHHTGRLSACMQAVVYFRRPLGIELNIFSESWSAKLAKAFGLYRNQDIRMGNDDFDSRFIVRANDESRLRAGFSSEIQEKMLSFVASRPTVNSERPNFYKGSFEVLDYCLVFTEGPFEGDLKIDWNHVEQAVVSPLVELATSIETAMEI